MIGSGTLAGTALAGRQAIYQQTISDAVKIWQANKNNTDPWILLIDVEIDETTIKHYVAGNPTGAPVPFKGDDYQPIGIDVGEIRQNIEGDLPEVEIEISNISGEAGYYVEAFDLEGNVCLLTFIPLSRIAAGDHLDEIAERFRIQNQILARAVVSVKLGLPDLRQKVPFQTYSRYKCQYVYDQRFNLENGCRYPSYEFEADMAMDFAVDWAVDTERELFQGMRGINIYRSAVVQSFDVDTTIPGHLCFEITGNTVTAEWIDSSAAGPFAYRLIAGDFDVYTAIAEELVDWRADLNFGILCQDPADTDEWISINWLAAGDLNFDRFQIETRKTVAGTTSRPGTIFPAEPGTRFLRMKRTGSTFQTFYSKKENEEWIQHQSYSMPAIGNTVRIGNYLAAPTSSAGDAAAAFEYLRFTAGGLATCSLLLDDSNGCRVHENSRRFRGFPGI